MAYYRLTARARSDLTRIWQYGNDKFGEDMADKYYNALFDRFEQIAENPYLYPTVDHIHQGYRRSVCGVDSIYYKIDGEKVVIISIIGLQDVNNLP